MKLKKYNHQIDQFNNGFRVDKYIKSLYPTFTKVFILKLIRKKDIKVNNQKTTPNHKLLSGDLVSILAPDNQDNEGIKKINFSKLPPLHVLFENAYVLVVHKPSGVNSEGKDYDNMNHRLQNHLSETHKTWTPSFAHRLDRNTSGIQIGAKDHKTLSHLHGAFKGRKVYKQYRALVHGRVSFVTHIISNYLIKNDQRVIIAKKDQPGAKLAISKIKTLKVFPNNTSLLQINIETGRTHQIRVHLSSIGHPIVGDQKYSSKCFKSSQKKICLISYSLSIDPNYCTDNLAELKDQTFMVKRVWFEEERKQMISQPSP